MEQEALKRHFSVSGHVTENDGATTVDEKPQTAENVPPAPQLDVDVVADGHENLTRLPGTTVANALNDGADAEALTIGTGPLTRTGTQLEASGELSVAINGLAVRANREQPGHAEGLDATSPLEQDTSKHVSSRITHVPGASAQTSALLMREVQPTFGDSNTTPKPLAHINSSTLPGLTHAASSTCHGSPGRKAEHFKMAPYTGAASSDGIRENVVHEVVSRDTDKASAMSERLAVMAPGTSIMEFPRRTKMPESAPTLPPGAHRSTDHKTSGNEDEAEEEFQALSPIRRYLVGQQKRQQIQKPMQVEQDDEQQHRQRRQENCLKTSVLRNLEADSIDTTGLQFLQLSAVSPLGELQEDDQPPEGGRVKQVSTGEIPTSSPVAPTGEDVLPAFANEENRRLHAEIQSMRQGLLHTNAKVAERKERIQMLSEHLKHVLLELRQTNQISTAKKESIKTEEHMTALLQRHASQLQRQAKLLVTKVDIYAEQLLSLKSEMVSSSAHLDQFKLQMNWNAAELKQWSVAEQQKQQDRLQVERLQRADEREVKKLTLIVEKVSTSTHKLKAKFYEQRTQARSIQVELESAATQFSGLQQERLHLIEQWEAGLESMQQGDKAIQHAAARYSMAQEEIKQKLAHLHSMHRFTNEQTAANAELQKRLQQLEKTTFNLREALAGAKSHLDLVNAKGEELRTHLSATTSAAAKTRKEISHLQEVLEGRKEQLAALKGRSIRSQRRIEAELRKATTEDEAFQNVEVFCRQLEQDCKVMQKQLKGGRQLLFEEAQQHATQQAANEAIYSELNSSKAALRNLLTQLHKLDQDRQRQQELLYAVEFQSQVMQRKVARAAGYRGTVEKKQLTAKIEKLTKLLDQQKHQVNMLTTQLRRLESELRKAQREQQVQHGEALTLTNVLENLRLECDSLRREATEKQKEKDSVYVEHDTLKLEVKKLRDQLRASHSAACTAEADKQQVQARIEEEIIKAENSLEVVRTTARVAYDERHKLLLELAKRKSKILNLESKYSVLVQDMKTDDGDGVERSQAYYTIKASQEKQDLQRVGDELDQKVRDAEQESRSLERTLQQLRERNQAFQKSLNAERYYVQHEREARTNYEAALIELHNKIYEQQQLATEFRKEKVAEERRISECLHHLSILLENVQSIGGSLEQLRREVFDQQEKLHRAKKQHTKALQAARVKKLLPHARPPNHAEDASLKEKASFFCYDPVKQFNIEMEPHLEGLKGHINSMLHSLATVLHDGYAIFPAAAVAVKEALADQGLALPSRPVSVAKSTDGGSVASSKRSSSNSASGLKESIIPSYRGSSAFYSGSFSCRQEGPASIIDGASFSPLSPSHRLIQDSFQSATSSVVSSAGGGSLRECTLESDKAGACRSATIQIPLSGVISKRQRGWSRAGRFENLRKVASAAVGAVYSRSARQSRGVHQGSASSSKVGR